MVDGGWWMAPVCGFAPVRTSINHPPLTIHHSSLRSQTPGRTQQSDFYGLDTNSERGDEQGYKGSEGKHPPADVDAVGKVLKPFSHEPPGDGGSNEKGYEYHNYVIGGEQPDDG